MTVKSILKAILPAGALIVALGSVGCDGETSDPATASKSDLNPPGKLVTVTRDSAIELRWAAGNVEDDFRGYYVFAVKKADYDAAKGNDGVVYPAEANVALAGIPRCALNTKFFEAFGLPATDADCEDGEEKKNDTGAGTTLTGGQMLADEAAPAEGEEAAEKLTGWVKCKGETGDLSLPAVAPQVKTQVCTVDTLANGTTKLENGTVYGFVVVAVAKDDLSLVSWSSNMVWDAPSKDTAVKDSEVELENGKAALITIDLEEGDAEVSDPVACDSACGRISETNVETATVPTIFLARTKENPSGAATNTFKFQQRLYISAPENSGDADVLIQPRGPQTTDPLAPGVSARIPGDAPASAFPSTAGTKYVVYNNQVFDFQVTKGDDNWYGKVVIGDVTYDGEALTSSATVKVTVVLQPKENVMYYMQ
jgi:hypothetical protein